MTKLSTITRPLIFHLLLLLSLVLETGCEKQETNNAAAFQPGVYDITLRSDTSLVRGALELVEAPDSMLYGRVELETSGYSEGPVSVERQSTDSIILLMLYDTLRLTRGDSLRGILYDREQTFEARLKYRQAEVSEDLQATTDYLPLQRSDGSFLEGRWPTLIDNESFYFIDVRQSPKQIEKAKLQDGRWTVTPLDYDPTAYQFSSLALSPDKRYLIAHGRSAITADSTVGNSDLYKVYLKNEDQVNRIEHLPRPVNTPGYDIFPYVAEDHSIYYGSNGQEANEGRMNIYRAVQTDTGYHVAGLGAAINTELPEAGPYLDPAGKFMLFYRRTEAGEDPSTDKIFLARQTAEGWSEPVMLGPPLNIGYSYEYGARLSPDQQYLYFTSDRRGRGHIYRIPVADIPLLAGL